MAKRVKIDDFDKAVAEILKEYGDNVTEATKRTVLKVAEKAKQETKAASPYKRGKASWHDRHYRSGWTVKKEAVNRFSTDAIIHNRTDYQRTHLLEKGHDVRNRKGGPVVGRAAAHEHIAPAQEHAVKNLEEAIRKIAKG